MIEGLEKRVVISGDSVISLYLAYLLKIKNPELHVAIISREKKNCNYFLSNEDSLKNTQLASLIDFKSIIKNEYKTFKINNKNNKEVNLKIKAKLYDYEKLKKYLYSSCISQNIEFFLDYNIISIDKNNVFLENIKTNEKKEFSYYKFIFLDDIDENIFFQKIKFVQKEFLSLIVDTKTKPKEVNLKIIDSKDKTFIFDQPIDEYKRKIIVFSKNKNKQQIFEEEYKNKEYKILLKENIKIKTIDSLEKFVNNFFFLSFSGNVYNHINIDDIYLSLLNAEIIVKLITNKIKYKKDIKNYEKEIQHLIKESQTSKQIINLLLSKTSAELDTIFIKINNMKVLENINLSSPRKELKKLALKPKYFLLLKEFLFK